MQSTVVPVRNHHLVQNGVSSTKKHQSESSSSFSNSDASQRIVTAAYPGYFSLSCKEPAGSSPLSGKRVRGASEQPPGFVNKFNRVVVGIIAFPERRGSPDKEPETGFPYLVGVQEIQHRTDRLGGFPGQVMEQGDLTGCYHGPYLFLGEQISTDQVGALITPRRVCTNLSHFNPRFLISHAPLVLLVI